MSSEGLSVVGEAVEVKVTESASSASSAIAALHNTINQCMQRCTQAAFPTAEREQRIGQIRAEAAALNDRHSTAFNDIIKVPQADLQSTVDELNQARSRLSLQVDELRKFQDGVQLAKGDLGSRLMTPTGELVPAIQQSIRGLDREMAVKSSESQKAISEAQSVVTRLEGGISPANDKFHREAALLRAKECPPALAAVFDEMKALVDKAGQLEQEVGVRAGAALVKEAKAQFADNATAFSAAEEFHRNQALILFVSMVAIGAVACGLIYFLFVRAEAGLSNQGSATPGGLAIFERIVLIGTGRVALLVMTGLSLKYIARLHQMHAEQSVIYRDRLAALGIAGNLLNATPELAQRREMLKSLMDVYLKFDDSAFGKHRKDAQTAEEAGGIDSQIKRVKALTEAISPLLAPVSKALDKAKDKAK